MVVTNLKKHWTSLGQLNLTEFIMILYCKALSLRNILVYSSDSQLGVREGTSWSANFSSLTIDISDDNAKNITSNGARGAKIIFPSGGGAGFKMN